MVCPAQVASFFLEKTHKTCDPTLDEEERMFGQLDYDNDGFINADDLLKYMTDNNLPGCSRKLARDMLREVHSEIQGKLTLKEFEMILSSLRLAGSSDTRHHQQK